MLLTTMTLANLLLGAGMPVHAGGSLGPAHQAAKTYAYIADYYGPGNGGHGVWRYPLAADGMPKAKADLTLDGGLVNPCCIALDASGDLFVSDVGARVVDEFAPGAHGNARPQRKIAFGSLVPSNLGVGKGGALYVMEGVSDSVLVFEPNVQPDGVPAHAIINWNSWAPVDDITVDSNGALYVSVLNTGVFVYANPEQEWTEPTYVLYIAPPSGYIPAYYYLALDEAERQAYVPFYPRMRDAWNQDLERVSGSASGNVPSDMLTKDCSHGGIISATVSGRYLLASCGGKPATILVYDKSGAGQQKSVASIGSFVSPGVIRLGP